MELTLKALKKNVKSILVDTVQVYRKIRGSKVQCNICGYLANKFESDIWHLYTICPRCRSQVRQRLLYASLSILRDLNFEKIISNKNVLHFAPEKHLSRLIRQRASIYKTADLFTEGYHYHGIDFNYDISNLDQVPSESYDCVIACDVLEHVPNHLDALREVNRILTVGGYCIFTVPQKDNLATTFEDPSIKDHKKREEVFGQFDHVRIYGDDFPELLKKYRFSVTAVNEDFFDQTLVQKYVLFPPVLSKNPLATNHRKVFFCEKLQNLE